MKRRQFLQAAGVGLINTSEDLKGLKFRVGGFAGTILTRIGTVPQQLAAGDIYPALEKGTIDAAEWVGPYETKNSASPRLPSTTTVNPQALLRLAGSGVQLRAFPQAVLEDCYKAASGIYAELLQTRPHFKKMYESLVPYRSGAYAWLQVAELSFDSFQIRMRART